MKSQISLFILVWTILGIFTTILPQDDIQIGSGYGTTGYRQTGAFFDYSDPNAVNIKVQLWGYVRYPGYYIVPAGSSVNELISFAGGPTEDALLDDIRVTKIKENSPTSMKKYNYNDLMWEDNIESKIEHAKLEAGDIVVVPGEPRYFLREDITFYLSFVTAIASLAALILSITSN